jgi:predicted metalloprotease with PDZ domain
MPCLLVTAATTVILANIGSTFADTEPVPTPRDVPYPGIMHLSVDATDIDRGIYAVHETLTVPKAGPMILLYPKWLPGDHAPRLPTEKLAGLTVSAGRQQLAWRRDSIDMSAFHITVPPGTTTLDIRFQYLSPLSPRDWPRLMTANILDIWWPTVTLYPAGYFSRQIMVETSVRLPEGFKLATALEVTSTDGEVTSFKPTSLNTLVDSSVVAGRYLMQFDLDPGAPAPVRIELFADRPENLEIRPELVAQYRSMVGQARKLFASRHYDHYDFLLWLSDVMTTIGLEHHQSSEDGVRPSYFKDWDSSLPIRYVLAHEYIHSWNGKFRRPADLWTPNFNVPMRDSLLWVYEGQTQYWSVVLAARSGLLSRQQALDALAMVAATCDHQPGRRWRTLQDTNNDPIFTEGRVQTWPSWQRNEDYYFEGQLIWLDVDTLIRQRSRGKRSLDDFAREFFGLNDGSHVTKTYTFEDVVHVLNTVEPFDWAGFLKLRLDSNGPGAPLDGLARGGYRLVYDDVASEYFRTSEAANEGIDLTLSLGLVTEYSGVITDVLWGGPAYKAGLTPGVQMIAVNGTAFDAGGLKDAVKAALGSGPAVQLLVKRGNRYRNVQIDYHDGPRYPHLERLTDIPPRLDDILTPLS